MPVCPGKVKPRHELKSCKGPDTAAVRRRGDRRASGRRHSSRLAFREGAEGRNLHEWPQFLGGPGHAGLSLDDSIKPPLKLLWTYRLDGDASGDAGGGVTVGGGLLYASVNNTKSIVALDADTGTFRWEYADSYPGYKDVPSYADGRLILWERGPKPRILALEAATGKTLWQHPLQDLKHLAARVRTGLALAQGLVYGCEGGEQPAVFALAEKTGKPVWQVSLKGDGPYLTPPSVAGGLVYVAARSALEALGAKQGAIIALDALTGKEAWRRTDIPSSKPLSTDGKVIACTLVIEGQLQFQLLDARTGKTRWSLPRTGAAAPAAMVGTDHILLKTSNGAFATLDRKTGKQLHSFIGRVRSGCCTPAIAGEYAFYGTGTTPPPCGGQADVESLSAFGWEESPREKGIVGNLHVIDLKSGKSVWNFGTGNTVCGDPALAYGRLYFTSRDGRVYCFVPANQDEAVTPEARHAGAAARPDQVKLLLHPERHDPLDGKSWPMSGGNPQRAGLDGVALNLPLQPVWKFDSGGRVQASAALRDGMVFIGSDAGKVLALNSASGKLVWDFNAGARCRCSPAVAGGIVYCGSDLGRFHALDAASGKEKWSFACGGPVQSSPAVVGGIVLFGANDHNVYALDRATGSKLWSFRMREYSIQAPVVVTGGQVLAGQWYDWVWALDLLTGKEQWRSHVPVSIEALALHQGKLYVRSPYYVIELDPASGKRCARPRPLTVTVAWRFKRTYCSSPACKGNTALPAPRRRTWRRSGRS